MKSHKAKNPALVADAAWIMATLELFRPKDHEIAACQDGPCVCRLEPWQQAAANAQQIGKWAAEGGKGVYTRAEIAPPEPPPGEVAPVAPADCPNAVCRGIGRHGGWCAHFQIPDAKLQAEEAPMIVRPDPEPEAEAEAEQAPDEAEAEQEAPRRGVARRRP